MKPTDFISSEGRKHYVIGIDPDVDKNGVAIVERETRRISLHSLTFCDTTDTLNEVAQVCDALHHSLLVIIEAGWLNQSNWHLRRFDSRALVVAKGVAQGRNEQVSRLLGEFCQHRHIGYRFQKPHRKCWQGTDRKITHRELASFCDIKKRTNQEERDAALLAWLGAGLPIRIPPKHT